MSNSSAVKGFLAFAALGAAWTLCAQTASNLVMIQTMPMPHVEGRIDHFGIDLKGQRLFMAALGNNSLEVFDLKANRWVQSVRGLHHPQGVLFVPESQKLFVANAEGGQVVIYADNVRLDAAAQQVYVGYGDGALAVLDAGDGRRLGDIKLDGHPESFQLEKSGPRIFVNVPSAGHIAVVDRKRREVVARWPLGGDGANFPMALDEANSRLFVACRKPPVLLVIDTRSGKTTARLDSPGDADDLWYDAAGKSLYVSGGEGVVGVIEQRGPDQYGTPNKIPSPAGARTSYWAPDLHRLYLAVPHRAEQEAEVRVYETRP
jgi:DNA-binding beta-propeller fold protein YncE